MEQLEWAAAMLETRGIDNISQAATVKRKRGKQSKPDGCTKKQQLADAVTDAPSDVPKKRGPGRPKGAKNKPKPVATKAICRPKKHT